MLQKFELFNHSSESVRYLGSKICEIIPAYMKEIPLKNLKLLLKDGNQNLVHVGYAESIYKIWATYRLEHKFVALFGHAL